MRRVLRRIPRMPLLQIAVQCGAATGSAPAQADLSIPQMIRYLSPVRGTTADISSGWQANRDTHPILTWLPNIRQR